MINNDGTDPVNGTFAGLPEDAIITLNSYPFQLSYQGGDGNRTVTLADKGITNANLTKALPTP